MIFHNSSNVPDMRAIERREKGEGSKEWRDRRGRRREGIESRRRNGENGTPFDKEEGKR